MIRFHPAVRRDLTSAMRHYEKAGRSLADDFWTKFGDICRQIDSHPRHFHFDACGWRRANLPRFPYHILFQEELDGVRVMVLRHHHRRTDFGMRRR